MLPAAQSRSFFQDYRMTRESVKALIAHPFHKQIYVEQGNMLSRGYGIFSAL